MDGEAGRSFAASRGGEEPRTLANVGEGEGEDVAILEAKRDELRNEGVEYCLSAYTDVHGVAKAKAVPIDHFVSMMRGSELFTGAAIDGLGQEPSDDEL